MRLVLLKREARSITPSWRIEKETTFLFTRHRIKLCLAMTRGLMREEEPTLQPIWREIPIGLQVCKETKMFMSSKLGNQKKSTLEEIPILSSTLITKNTKNLAQIMQEEMKIGDLTDKKLIPICFKKTITIQIWSKIL